MQNSQFAVAVHALDYLGWFGMERGGELIPSEEVAASINTNPVVVRRLLGALRKAGLVESQPGPGGGWRLVGTPAEINLRGVYRALATDPLFAPPHREPSAVCPVGRHVQKVVGRIVCEAETAMEERLMQVSLADVMEAVAERAGRRPRSVHLSG